MSAAATTEAGRACGFMHQDRERADTEQHRKLPTYNQRRGQTEPQPTRERVVCVHTCVCARVYGTQNIAVPTSVEAIGPECQPRKEVSFEEGAAV